MSHHIQQISTIISQISQELSVLRQKTTQRHHQYQRKATDYNVFNPTEVVTIPPSLHSLFLTLQNTIASFPYRQYDSILPMVDQLLFDLVLPELGQIAIVRTVMVQVITTLYVNTEWGVGELVSRLVQVMTSPTDVSVLRKTVQPGTLMITLELLASLISLYPTSAFGKITSAQLTTLLLSLLDGTASFTITSFHLDITILTLGCVQALTSDGQIGLGDMDKIHIVQVMQYVLSLYCPVSPMKSHMGATSSSQGALHPSYPRGHGHPVGAGAALGEDGHDSSIAKPLQDQMSIRTTTSDTAQSSGPLPGQGGGASISPSSAGMITNRTVHEVTTTAASFINILLSDLASETTTQQCCTIRSSCYSILFQLLQLSGNMTYFTHPHYHTVKPHDAVLAFQGFIVKITLLSLTDHIIFSVNATTRSAWIFQIARILALSIDFYEHNSHTYDKGCVYHVDPVNSSTAINVESNPSHTTTITAASTTLLTSKQSLSTQSASPLITAGPIHYPSLLHDVASPSAASASASGSGPKASSSSVLPSYHLLHTTLNSTLLQNNTMSNASWLHSIQFPQIVGDMYYVLSTVLYRCFTDCTFASYGALFTHAQMNVMAVIGQLLSLIRKQLKSTYMASLQLKIDQIEQQRHKEFTNFVIEHQVAQQKLKSEGKKKPTRGGDPESTGLSSIQTRRYRRGGGDDDDHGDSGSDSENDDDADTFHDSDEDSMSDTDDDDEAHDDEDFTSRLASKPISSVYASGNNGQIIKVKKDHVYTAVDSPLDSSSLYTQYPAARKSSSKSKGVTPLASAAAAGSTATSPSSSSRAFPFTLGRFSGNPSSPSSSPIGQSIANPHHVITTDNGCMRDDFTPNQILDILAILFNYLTSVDYSYTNATPGQSTPLVLPPSIQYLIPNAHRHIQQHRGSLLGHLFTHVVCEGLLPDLKSDNMEIIVIFCSLLLLRTNPHSVLAGSSNVITLYNDAHATKVDQSASATAKPHSQETRTNPVSTPSKSRWFTSMFTGGSSSDTSSSQTDPSTAPQSSVSSGQSAPSTPTPSSGGSSRKSLTSKAFGLLTSSFSTSARTDNTHPSGAVGATALPAGDSYFASSVLAAAYGTPTPFQSFSQLFSETQLAMTAFSQAYSSVRAPMTQHLHEIDLLISVLSGNRLFVSIVDILQTYIALDKRFHQQYSSEKAAISHTTSTSTGKGTTSKQSNAFTFDQDDVASLETHGSSSSQESVFITKTQSGSEVITSPQLLYYVIPLLSSLLTGLNLPQILASISLVQTLCMASPSANRLLLYTSQKKLLSSTKSKTNTTVASSSQPVASDRIPAALDTLVGKKSRYEFSIEHLQPKVPIIRMFYSFPSKTLSLHHLIRLPTTNTQLSINPYHLWAASQLSTVGDMMLHIGLSYYLVSSSTTQLLYLGVNSGTSSSPLVEQAGDVLLRQLACVNPHTFADIVNELISQVLIMMKTDFDAPAKMVATTTPQEDGNGGESTEHETQKPHEESLIDRLSPSTCHILMKILPLVAQMMRRVTQPAAAPSTSSGSALESSPQYDIAQSLVLSQLTQLYQVAFLLLLSTRIDMTVTATDKRHQLDAQRYPVIATILPFMTTVFPFMSKLSSRHAPRLIKWVASTLQEGFHPASATESTKAYILQHKSPLVAQHMELKSLSLLLLRQIIATFQRRLVLGATKTTMELSEDSETSPPASAHSESTDRASVKPDSMKPSQQQPQQQQRSLLLRPIIVSLSLAIKTLKQFTASSTGPPSVTASRETPHDDSPQSKDDRAHDSSPSASSPSSGPGASTTGTPAPVIPSIVMYHLTRFKGILYNSLTLLSIFDVYQLVFSIYPIIFADVLSSSSSQTSLLAQGIPAVGATMGDHTGLKIPQSVSMGDMGLRLPSSSLLLNSFDSHMLSPLDDSVSLRGANTTYPGLLYNSLKSVTGPEAHHLFNPFLTSVCLDTTRPSPSRVMSVHTSIALDHHKDVAITNHDIIDAHKLLSTFDSYISRLIIPVDISQHTGRGGLSGSMSSQLPASSSSISTSERKSPQQQQHTTVYSISTILSADTLVSLCNTVAFYTIYSSILLREFSGSKWPAGQDIVSSATQPSKASKHAQPPGSRSAGTDSGHQQHHTSSSKSHLDYHVGRYSTLSNCSNTLAGLVMLGHYSIITPYDRQLLQTEFEFLLTRSCQLDSLPELDQYSYEVVPVDIIPSTMHDVRNTMLYSTIPHPCKPYVDQLMSVSHETGILCALRNVQAMNRFKHPSIARNQPQATSPSGSSATSASSSPSSSSSVLSMLTESIQCSIVPSTIPSAWQYAFPEVSCVNHAILALVCLLTKMSTQMRMHLMYRIASILGSLQSSHTTTPNRSVILNLFTCLYMFTRYIAVLQDATVFVNQPSHSSNAMAASSTSSSSSHGGLGGKHPLDLDYTITTTAIIDRVSTELEPHTTMDPMGEHGQPTQLQPTTSPQHTITQPVPYEHSLLLSLVLNQLAAVPQANGPSIPAMLSSMLVSLLNIIYTHQLHYRCYTPSQGVDHDDQHHPIHNSAITAHATISQLLHHVITTIENGIANVKTNLNLSILPSMSDIESPPSSRSPSSSASASSLPALGRHSSSKTTFLPLPALHAPASHSSPTVLDKQQLFTLTNDKQEQKYHALAFTYVYSTDPHTTKAPEPTMVTLHTPTDLSLLAKIDGGDHSMIGSLTTELHTPASQQHAQSGDDDRTDPDSSAYGQQQQPLQSHRPLLYSFPIQLPRSTILQQRLLGTWSQLLTSVILSYAQLFTVNTVFVELFERVFNNILQLSPYQSSSQVHVTTPMLLNIYQSQLYRHITTTTTTVISTTASTASQSTQQQQSQQNPTTPSSPSSASGTTAAPTAANSAGSATMSFPPKPISTTTSSSSPPVFLSIAPIPPSSNELISMQCFDVLLVALSRYIDFQQAQHTLLNARSVTSPPRGGDDVDIASASRQLLLRQTSHVLYRLFTSIVDLNVSLNSLKNGKTDHIVTYMKIGHRLCLMFADDIETLFLGHGTTHKNLNNHLNQSDHQSHGGAIGIDDSSKTPSPRRFGSYTDSKILSYTSLLSIGSDTNDGSSTSIASTPINTSDNHDTNGKPTTAYQVAITPTFFPLLQALLDIFSVYAASYYLGQQHSTTSVHTSHSTVSNTIIQESIELYITRFYPIIGDIYRKIITSVQLMKTTAKLNLLQLYTATGPSSADMVPPSGAVSAIAGNPVQSQPSSTSGDTSKESERHPTESTQSLPASSLRRHGSNASTTTAIGMKEIHRNQLSFQPPTIYQLPYSHLFLQLHFIRQATLHPLSGLASIPTGTVTGSFLSHRRTRHMLLSQGVLPVTPFMINDITDQEYETLLPPISSAISSIGLRMPVSPSSPSAGNRTHQGGATQQSPPASPTALSRFSSYDRNRPPSQQEGQVDHERTLSPSSIATQEMISKMIAVNEQNKAVSTTLLTLKPSQPLTLEVSSGEEMPGSSIEGGSTVSPRSATTAAPTPARKQTPIQQQYQQQIFTQQQSLCDVFLPTPLHQQLPPSAIGSALTANMGLSFTPLYTTLLIDFCEEILTHIDAKDVLYVVTLFDNQVHHALLLLLRLMEQQRVCASHIQHGYQKILFTLEGLLRYTVELLVMSVSQKHVLTQGLTIGHILTIQQAVHSILFTLLQVLSQKRLRCADQLVLSKLNIRNNTPTSIKAAPRKSVSPGGGAFNATPPTTGAGGKPPNHQQDQQQLLMSMMMGDDISVDIPHYTPADGLQWLSSNTRQQPFALQSLYGAHSPAGSSGMSHLGLAHGVAGSHLTGASEEQLHAAAMISPSHLSVQSAPSNPFNLPYISVDYDMKLSQLYATLPHSPQLISAMAGATMEFKQTCLQLLFVFMTALQNHHAQLLPFFNAYVDQDSTVGRSGGASGASHGNSASHPQTISAKKRYALNRAKFIRKRSHKHRFIVPVPVTGSTAVGPSATRHVLSSEHRPQAYKPADYKTQQQRFKQRGKKRQMIPWSDFSLVTLPNKSNIAGVGDNNHPHSIASSASTPQQSTQGNQQSTYYHTVSYNEQVHNHRTLLKQVFSRHATKILATVHPLTIYAADMVNIALELCATASTSLSDTHLLSEGTRGNTDQSTHHHTGGWLFTPADSMCGDTLAIAGFGLLRSALELFGDYSYAHYQQMCSQQASQPPLVSHQQAGRSLHLDGSTALVFNDDLRRMIHRNRLDIIGNALGRVTQLVASRNTVNACIHRALSLTAQQQPQSQQQHLDDSVTKLPELLHMFKSLNPSVFTALFSCFDVLKLDPLGGQILQQQLGTLFDSSSYTSAIGNATAGQTEGGNHAPASPRLHRAGSHGHSRTNALSDIYRSYVNHHQQTAKAASGNHHSLSESNAARLSQEFLTYINTQYRVLQSGGNLTLFLAAMVQTYERFSKRYRQLDQIVHRLLHTGAQGNALPAAASPPSSIPRPRMFTNTNIDISQFPYLYHILTCTRSQVSLGSALSSAAFTSSQDMSRNLTHYDGSSVIGGYQSPLSQYHIIFPTMLANYIHTLTTRGKHVNPSNLHEGYGGYGTATGTTHAMSQPESSLVQPMMLSPPMTLPSLMCSYLGALLHYLLHYQHDNITVVARVFTNLISYLLQHHLPVTTDLSGKSEPSTATTTASQKHTKRSMETLKLVVFPTSILQSTDLLDFNLRLITFIRKKEQDWSSPLSKGSTTAGGSSPSASTGQPQKQPTTQTIRISMSYEDQFCHLLLVKMFMYLLSCYDEALALISAAKGGQPGIDRTLATLGLQLDHYLQSGCNLAAMAYTPPPAQLQQQQQQQKLHSTSMQPTWPLLNILKLGSSFPILFTWIRSLVQLYTHSTETYDAQAQALSSPSRHGSRQGGKDAQKPISLNSMTVPTATASSAVGDDATTTISSLWQPQMVAYHETLLSELLHNAVVMKASSNNSGAQHIPLFIHGGLSVHTSLSTGTSSTQIDEKNCLNPATIYQYRRSVPVIFDSYCPSSVSLPIDSEAAPVSMASTAAIEPIPFPQYSAHASVLIHLTHDHYRSYRRYLTSLVQTYMTLSQQRESTRYISIASQAPPRVLMTTLPSDFLGNPSDKTSSEHQQYLPLVSSTDKTFFPMQEFQKLIGASSHAAHHPDYAGWVDGINILSDSAAQSLGDTLTTVPGGGGLFTQSGNSNDDGLFTIINLLNHHAASTHWAVSSLAPSSIAPSDMLTASSTDHLLQNLFETFGLARDVSTDLMARLARSVSMPVNSQDSRSAPSSSLSLTINGLLPQQYLDLAGYGLTMIHSIMRYVQFLLNHDQSLATQEIVSTIIAFMSSPSGKQLDTSRASSQSKDHAEDSGDDDENTHTTTNDTDADDADTDTSYSSQVAFLQQFVGTTQNKSIVFHQSPLSLSDFNPDQQTTLQALLHTHSLSTTHLSTLLSCYTLVDNCNKFIGFLTHVLVHLVTIISSHMVSSHQQSSLPPSQTKQLQLSICLDIFSRVVALVKCPQLSPTDSPILPVVLPVCQLKCYNSAISVLQLLYTLTLPMRGSAGPPHTSTAASPTCAAPYSTPYLTKSILIFLNTFYVVLSRDLSYITSMKRYHTDYITRCCSADINQREIIVCSTLMTIQNTLLQCSKRIVNAASAYSQVSSMNVGDHSSPLFNAPLASYAMILLYAPTTLYFDIVFSYSITMQQYQQQQQQQGESSPLSQPNQLISNDDILACIQVLLIHCRKPLPLCQFMLYSITSVLSTYVTRIATSTPPATSSGAMLGTDEQLPMLPDICKHVIARLHTHFSSSKPLDGPATATKKANSTTTLSHMSKLTSDILLALQKTIVCNFNTLFLTTLRYVPLAQRSAVAQEYLTKISIPMLANYTTHKDDICYATLLSVATMLKQLSMTAGKDSTADSADFRTYLNQQQKEKLDAVLKEE